MPITKITVENFKGIGDPIEIPIRPITLLFGANSAGKSTILQALLYLRELLERENADADRLLASGAAIDLGGFRQFVHGHDLERKVRIGVELSVDADGLPTFPQHFPGNREDVLELGTIRECDKASVELEVGWDKRTSSPWVTRYRVGINGQWIGTIKAQPGLSANITFFDTGHSILESQLDPGDTSEEDPHPVVQPLRSALEALDSGEAEEGDDFKIPLRARVVPTWGVAIPIDESTDPELEADFAFAQFVLSQIFVGIGELALKELRGIRHIGSFRDIPERRFNVRRSPAEERWANGAGAWDLLYNSDLEWFDEEAFNSLGLGYQLQRQSFFEVPTDGAIGSFLIRSQMESEIYLSELESLPIKRELQRLAEKSQVRLIEDSRGVEVEPNDVGVGVSQIIPVVIGAMAPGYSILSVEQPELHTHPAVQCALADVLAKEVVDSTDRCLLLETHSEHLMLRWLRRIRELHEEELPPGAPAIRADQLSVLYVESGDEGQKITVLPVTEDGDFAEKWPQGFFEERADELF